MLHNTFCLRIPSWRNDSWKFKIQTSLSSSTFEGSIFSSNLVHSKAKACKKVVYKTILQVSLILTKSGSKEFYLLFADFWLNFGIVILKLKGLGKIAVPLFELLVKEHLVKIWTTSIKIWLSYGLRKGQKLPLKLTFPFMVTSGYFKFYDHFGLFVRKVFVQAFRKCVA